MNVATATTPDSTGAPSAADPPAGGAEAGDGRLAVVHPPTLSRDTAHRHRPRHRAAALGPRARARLSPRHRPPTRPSPAAERRDEETRTVAELQARPLPPGQVPASP